MYFTKYIHLLGSGGVHVNYGVGSPCLLGSGESMSTGEWVVHFYWGVGGP